MLGLPIAFAAPILLAALVGLPALWYLLRVTPPPPQLQPLPTMPLIRDLVSEERRPAHTPWWLLLLRCLIAALVILAMAGPTWAPDPTVTSARNGPVLVVMDDGWASAPDWRQRQAFAERMIGQLGDRPVALRSVSESNAAVPVGAPAAALEKLRRLEPQAHHADRAALQPVVATFLAENPDGEVYWLSDRVAIGDEQGFLASLGTTAGDRLTVVAPEAQRAIGLAGQANTQDAIETRLIRATATENYAGLVRALDQRGRTLGETAVALPPGTLDQVVKIDMPLELRNEVTRIEIASAESAGAVQLVDSSNRRRRVGLVSGETADNAQPLVSPAYFLRKALEPFAEIREAPASAPDPITRLIDDGASMIVLADIGTLSGSTYEKLKAFVERGGVLVRFSGLRLAAAGDDLLPVKLLQGGRLIGGALSWEEPQKLAPFAESGPFAGLGVPNDVAVGRQVLAEPDGDLADKTWAVLTDGTPLVTGERRGQGTIALFHVTADTSWSSLPLSGLFVDMLRRLVVLARAGDPATQNQAGITTAGSEAPDVVAPLRVLDGFGRFRSPPATAKAIDRNVRMVATAEHPAGLYGQNEGQIAVNVLNADARLAVMAPAGGAARNITMTTAQPFDLRPWLLALALGLFLIDALAGMAVAGAFQRLRRAAATAALVLAAGVVFAPVDDLHAETVARPDQFKRDQLPNFSSQDVEAALETRLAYVITGNSEIDETSRMGLQSLSEFLAAKTALEPAEPVGLDPVKDEMVYYPVIYWPLADNAGALPEAAIRKIDAYMKNGGTVIFDTRDAYAAPEGATSVTPETAALRSILGALDVPALEPIPTAHVVTKSFFLLERFVGRYASGQTWIEALPPDNGDQLEERPARAGDRVSPIIITSNDLAGAWAMDSEGNTRYPLQGQDEADREMAFRAGVNLVIYVLTGNYKSDQVHVPALLERLGQ
jgi:hypothetical protein